MITRQNMQYQTDTTILCQQKKTIFCFWLFWFYRIIVLIWLLYKSASVLIISDIAVSGQLNQHKLDDDQKPHFSPLTDNPKMLSMSISRHLQISYNISCSQNLHHAYFNDILTYQPFSYVQHLTNRANKKNKMVWNRILAF